MKPPMRYFDATESIPYPVGLDMSLIRGVKYATLLPKIRFSFAYQDLLNMFGITAHPIQAKRPYWRRSFKSS